MRRALAASAIALMAGTTAQADPWSVLVIGDDGDAIAVSSRLSAAGVADVRHLLDGGPRDIVDAVAGLAGAERALVYYNGALTERAGQPAIADDPRLTMAALADALTAGGARQAAILIENCGGAGQGVSVAPPVGSLRGDILLAASAGPGASCAGPVLSEALLGAGLDTPLTTALGTTWIGVRPSGTFSLDPGTGAAPASVAFLEARPEGTAVAPPPASDAIQTALFIAPPASQIAAIPVRAGYPDPSIIVGILQIEPEPTEAAVVVGETEAEGLEGLGEITYDNLEARVALRESDPDLFGTLVESGAFDPPQAELALAIQTELKRMDCYTSLLDGDFGPGSRRAVTSYYDERDLGVPPSTDPTAELFRLIIAAEDVTCPPPPAPVAAAPSRSTSSSTSSSSTRTTTTTRAAPAPSRPAPTPAPSNSGTRTIQSGGGGIGVFR